MEPCYNEDLFKTKNFWKPSRITVKYVETNPAITIRFWHSQPTTNPTVTCSCSGCLQQSLEMTDLSRNHSLPYSSFDKYVYCTIVVFNLCFSLLTRLPVLQYWIFGNSYLLNYPAITNIFAVNQIIWYWKPHYNKQFFSVPWRLIIAELHCIRSSSHFCLELLSQHFKSCKFTITL